MADDRDDNDDVEAALAILRDAGFPIGRIRILPADTAGERDGDGAPDRGALLDACLAVLADGEARSAKDLARLVRDRAPGTVTRKDINSVLSREGKERVTYDRETFAYRLRG